MALHDHNANLCGRGAARGRVASPQRWVSARPAAGDASCSTRSTSWSTSRSAPRGARGRPGVRRWCGPRASDEGDEGGEGEDDVHGRKSALTVIPPPVAVLSVRIDFLPHSWQHGPHVAHHRRRRAGARRRLRARGAVRGLRHRPHRRRGAGLRLPGLRLAARRGHALDERHRHRRDRTGSTRPAMPTSSRCRPAASTAPSSRRSSRSCGRRSTAAAACCRCAPGPSRSLPRACSTAAPAPPTGGMPPGWPRCAPAPGSTSTCSTSRTGRSSRVPARPPASTPACTSCAPSSARRSPTRIARRMVVPPHRAGGQRSTSRLPCPTSPATASRTCSTRCSSTSTATTRSPRSRGGPRCRSAPSPGGSVPRSARRRTSGSPRQRVLRARHLLETTDLDVERIAARERLRDGGRAAPPLPAPDRRPAAHLPQGLHPAAGQRLTRRCPRMPLYAENADPVATPILRKIEWALSAPWPRSPEVEWALSTTSPRSPTVELRGHLRPGARPLAGVDNDANCRLEWGGGWNRYPATTSPRCPVSWAVSRVRQR